MNKKSPAAILVESITTGRVAMSHLSIPFKKPSLETEEASSAYNYNNESPKQVKDTVKYDDNNILDFSENPEKFWKCWSLVHSQSGASSSPKGCSCFEGIGSVM